MHGTRSQSAGLDYSDFDFATHLRNLLREKRGQQINRWQPSANTLGPASDLRTMDEPHPFPPAPRKVQGPLTPCTAPRSVRAQIVLAASSNASFRLTSGALTFVGLSVRIPEGSSFLWSSLVFGAIQFWRLLVGQPVCGVRISARVNWRSHSEPGCV